MDNASVAAQSKGPSTQSGLCSNTAKAHMLHSKGRARMGRMQRQLGATERNLRIVYELKPGCISSIFCPPCQMPWHLTM